MKLITEIMYHVPSKINNQGKVFWCKLCDGIVGCDDDTWQEHLITHLRFYPKQLEIMLELVEK